MATTEQKLERARRLYVDLATKAARERVERARPGKQKREAEAYLAQWTHDAGVEFDLFIVSE